MTTFSPLNKSCDRLAHFHSPNAMSIRKLSRNFVIWKTYVHFFPLYSTSIPTLYSV